MFKTTGGRVKSFIITTKSTEPEFDFLSRNFVPWAGIPEDAGKKICSVASGEGSFQMKRVLFSVTGSAHTVLVSLWSALLNKTVMRARQCSARGGDLGSVSHTFVSKTPNLPLSALN